LGIVAIAALVFGAIVGTAPGRAEHRLVTKYGDAWAHRDYARLYALLDDGSRKRISESRFAATLEAAATTATLAAIVPVHVGSRKGDVVPVLVVAHTKLFGKLRETLQVTLSGSGSGAAVRYSGTL